MNNGLALNDWSLGMAALRGAASWSDVFLPEPLWGRYARAAEGARSPSEVYIAIAIAEGVPGALEAFEEMYFNIVDQVLRRVGATSAEVDELEDMLHRRLIATQINGRPLIVAYAGQGELASLLRVAALRAFLDLRTCRNQPVFGDRAGLLPILDAIPDHSRAAVRLSVLHGLGVDDISDRLRESRSVVARKLRWSRHVLAACAQHGDIAYDVIDVLLEASLGGD